jgi:hypothetical protein
MAVPDETTLDPEIVQIQLEDAEAERNEPLDLTGDERRLVTQPYDLSVSSLVEDIDAGRLLLRMEYQRSYVWDDAKASRLIESLLLNVPIPVCYFAENEDGTLEVVDGQQRLQSIWRFISPKAPAEERLTLRGTTVLSELNDAPFERLSNRDQRRIQNRTIRCIVITEDSHADIKFDVFERLNTGAVRLSDQELRNSIYRGPFNDAIKETARFEPFQRALGGQLVSRMDDCELVLRFVALADRLTAYKPPLRQFLSEYMREHREDVAHVTPLLERFKAAAATAETVFGTNAFRRVNRAGAAGRTVNKALYDTVMLSLYFADNDEVVARKDEVVTALREVLENPDFDALIGRATADRSRVFGRIVVFSDKLAQLAITTTYREAVPQE